MSWEIRVGNCVEALLDAPESCADSIVTDPPYGLGFMGKAWDSLPPGHEVGKALLHALKPGGHLVAFGGTRTSHRLVCALEDAGFEIRDSLMWIYGSGFPKSLDVSKAIDKAAGAAREQINATGGLHSNRNLNDDGWSKIGSDSPQMDGPEPATDAAREWVGWGTALKPAHEPIVLARKPLSGTVAANVAEHGTGALNVDACRVGTEKTITRRNGNSGAHGRFGRDERVFERENPAGRWPPNVLLSHAACCGDECGPCCAVAELDRQSGDRPSASSRSRPDYSASSYKLPQRQLETCDYAGDSGGASRFFPRFRYVPKASSSERNAGLEGMPEVWQPTMNDGIGGREHNEAAAPARENHHPTVKPLDLMRWLCRLITPPGGLVLDPFAGSGTTGIAALREGFRFLGIEQKPDYAAIARRRIEEDAPLFQRMAATP